MSMDTLTPRIEIRTDEEELPRGSIAVSDKDLIRAAKIKTVVENLATGLSIQESCSRAGIHVNTWANWRNEGLVQDILESKFSDVIAGVRELVAESLVPSTRVLTALARGQRPEGTEIKGVMAPRDVVAAQQHLLTLWQKIGGIQDPEQQENKDVLDALKAKAVAVSVYQIQTVNVGPMDTPTPVVSGVIIDGESELVEEEEMENGG